VEPRFRELTKGRKTRKELFYIFCRNTVKYVLKLINDQKKVAITERA